MPKTLHMYTDGKTLKNIDLPQYPNSAWEWISEAPQDMKETELYARVASVYRVANLTATAISNIPFVVMRGEDEIDSSENWENAVGFMPRPRELLRLWRLSLFFTNSAYGFMEGNRVIKNLRYIVPTTITPVANRDGLAGFKRRIGSEVTEYSLKDNRIFYIFRLDHTTELLPAEATEFRALMAAAGVLFYADYYIQNFFQRGGIKPSLLSVKGVPTPQEREKIESVWDKVLHGWNKFTGKVISADSMDVKVIGEGIDNLTDDALHKAKIEDVAMASGIPLSILLANSANYATAMTEYNTWFRDSVVPWAHFIQETMNDQLFKPLGLKFEFRPEMSSQGQEEERQRSAAYVNYINAGMKPSVAAQVMGIDLPDDIEYAQLDADFEQMKQGDEEQTAKAPKQTDRDAELLEQQEQMKAVEPTLLTIDQLRELELWQSFALRKLKQDKSLAFPFVCKVVPEELAATIRGRLPGCKSEEDIIGAFELTPREDDALKELAAALNAAVEKFVEVA